MVAVLIFAFVAGFGWAVGGVGAQGASHGGAGVKEQIPSVGRIVHFMYGGVHVPAIITDPAFVVREPGKPDWIGQALTVFLPAAAPFTTVATHQDEVAPGTWNNATWHWPEYVPAKDEIPF